MSKRNYFLINSFILVVLALGLSACFGTPTPALPPTRLPDTSVEDTSPTW
ncbi:MAG: hypothetical protein HZB77_05395 [Chloroflexi bacterium]|nr:hypothetical protein [Chloroflexota bacterium]